MDFGYFTDPDGHDEQTIVDGIRIARQVAATEPFASWIAREIAPGPELTTDEQLSAYGRAAHHTVYHPAGTCRMGADPRTSVCDENGEVHGTRGLFVADASAFPAASGVNPMVTVMALAHHVATRLARTFQ